MSFPIWATVFTDTTGPNSVVPAAFLNQIRTQIPDALDGASGGTYSPTSTLRINGGFGLTVLTLKVPNTGILTLQSGSQLLGDTGSLIQTDGLASFTSTTLVGFSGTETFFAGGAAIVQNGHDWAITGAYNFNNLGRVNINSGAKLVVSGTGDIELNTGTLLEIKSGAQLQVDSGGTSILAGAGSWTSTGSLSVLAGFTATISTTGWTWGATSTQNYTSGATVNVNGSSIFHFKDSSDLSMEGTSTLTIGSTANIAVLSGGDVDVDGSINVKATGAVVYTSGSTESGTRTDSSTTTRSGATIFSGNNAMRGNRIVTFDITGLSGSVTIDAWHHDLIVSNGQPGTGNTRTWRLTTPPNNVKHIVEIDGYSLSDVSSQGSLVIKDDDSNATIATFTSGAYGTVRFYFDGTAWKVLHPAIGFT